MNRRFFLQKSGMLVASPLALSYLASCQSNNNSSQNSERPSALLGDFGIQLWTVKEEMAKDPKGTLKALASYGYKQIESFQGAEGIFWGMTPADFKSFTSDLGLQVISSHTDPEFALKPEKLDAFKKLVEEAQMVGLSHVINPYLGFLKTLDDFKKATEQFNVLGEIAQKAGLKYGYHNHHYSFMKIENEYPQDIMMKGTDADKVDFEMDLYWVIAAQQDPTEWMAKYPGRFKLLHLKDMYKSDKIEEIKKTEDINPAFPLNASCLLGTGQLDFPKLIQAGKTHGADRFIMEQERFDGTTLLQAAEKNAQYLKALTA